MKVKSIRGRTIEFVNKSGTTSTHKSSDLMNSLSKSVWSADQYEKEVTCNLTDLARILPEC